MPVIITWDVDPDRWASPAFREAGLSRAMDLCEQAGVHSTFFITAKFAHEFNGQIDRMQAFGHEIGCHGLTHSGEEEYGRMPADMQRAYIEEATRRLKAVTGSRIVSFRSPRVKTSAHTLALLAESGYLVDSSVCSQRVDLVSSNLINPGWIVAPRRPYHPHPTNAFRRGSLPIWEIPVSAAILPFVSSTLSIFGLRAMKAFFRLLYEESKHTGKPIVYLAHPPELVASKRAHSPPLRKHLSLNRLSPGFIRIHGFSLRRVLYRMDGDDCYAATRELLAHMATFPGVVFLPIGSYAARFLPGAGVIEPKARN